MRRRERGGGRGEEGMGSVEQRSGSLETGVEMC